MDYQYLKYTQIECKLVSFISSDQHLYYKTLQISELVDCLLCYHLLAWTNTLAYCRVPTLWICNVVIVQATVLALAPFSKWIKYVMNPLVLGKWNFVTISKSTIKLPWLHELLKIGWILLVVLSPKDPRQANPCNPGQKHQCYYPNVYLPWLLGSCRINILGSMLVAVSSNVLFHNWQQNFLL
jgi:hypothetical protein